MKENNNNNRIVAYFSTSSSTSGGQLPSLLDTTSDVDSKVSSSQQKKRRQSNNIRQQQRCSKVFDISKRLLVYGIALAAIASSVVSIFSCNFFSYTDIAVATDAVDGFTSALENDTNDSETLDLGYQYTPFEFMNEAGVGLFAYYMGDPSAGQSTILYKQEPMCFLYCDELHDFYWFSNNYNPGNKGLLARKIDLWIVAQYCSIMAPIVAFLGLLQLIVVENWFCGCRIYIATHTAKVASSLFLFLTFLSASLLQFGTFSILLASPNLSSPSQNDGTTYQDSFCFSTTTTSNNYMCQLDTGAFYSLGSGLIYLVLAVYSSLSTYSSSSSTTTTTPKTSATTDDGNNNKENADHTSTRSLLCCGGCCLRRGDGDGDDDDGESESNNGTHSPARKGGISNNNNNNDEDQKVVSSHRKRVVAVGDSEEKSETSDSSNYSSSTSKLISKLSYNEGNNDEEEHDDEGEHHEEDDVRSGGAFSFFGSEITF